MKNNEKESVFPPDWLDLGNINEVKIGDEVTTVGIENGAAIVGSRISTVRLIEDWRILTERDGKASGGWIIKNKGGCRQMYGSPYFYSANPEHIKKAKQNAKRAIEATKRREEEEKEKLAIFEKELSELLKKHGASLYITFGEGSDTHGIYDEKIVASIGSQSVAISE